MIIFCLFLAFFLPSLDNESQEQLTTANQFYVEGKQASILLAKKEAFNRALILYVDFSEKKPTWFHSEKLNEAIADLYYQLNEPAWAILYAYKALSLNPHSQNAPLLLNLAQTQLGLKEIAPPSLFDQILSLFGYLSWPRRWTLLFVFLLLLLIGRSGLIWSPNNWLKKFVGVLSGVTSLLLFNILLSFYFSTIEGVLIFSSGLYTQPSWEQPQVMTSPLLKGYKVSILDMSPNNEWTKIKTSDGMTGYIPTFAIRII